MSTSTDLFTLIDSSALLSSFFGGLLSGLVLLVLASFILPKYLNWRQRPKIRLVPFDKHIKSFEFTNSTDGQWESTVQMVIQNRGNKTIDRFYWEIFIKNDVGVEMDRQNNSAEFNYEIVAQKNGYNRIYGYMAKPVFSLEVVDFPFRIKIKSKERRPMKIYYYFKTDLGQYPFYAWIGVAYEKYSLFKSLSIN